MVKWSNDLGPGPILVHIDMDYFNNRYDGDSDWAKCAGYGFGVAHNIGSKEDPSSCKSKI